ncbi:unnamed protein product [Podospora anserina S mat+]|uniref:Podospora anserina S mat+ genomic DNA chromosome 3, supercontig 2 n=2 Tax=Podospora TaxID=5144 RepID=B2B039_PODAN|nr:unnamed protein product [Podospora anserina S mat+]CDP27143.1 Putative protein of unknown function [Podospora anserina S mat+]VBB77260.1 Putative protein of unknown function [Podospora comata]
MTSFPSHSAVSVRHAIPPVYPPHL